MNKYLLAICGGVLLCGASVYGQRYADLIPAGTRVPVRTNERIDVRDARDGRVFTGVIESDVLDESGSVAIPRGSNAELIIRNVSRDEMALDMESVSVNGRRYAVSTTDMTRGGQRQGVGANKRTGEYVGGGAVLGTIIGAIAGGGKGAAIGAAVGAAGGAGTQVLTRGRNVNVPAESVLTFRLDQPLRVDVRDTGYDRNGRHYHKYQY
jgi:hypothetical protein